MSEENINYGNNPFENIFPTDLCLCENDYKPKDSEKVPEKLTKFSSIHFNYHLIECDR